MKLWDQVRAIVQRVYFGAGKFTEGEEVIGMISSFGADCIEVHVPERGRMIVGESACTLIPQDKRTDSEALDEIQRISEELDLP